MKQNEKHGEIRNEEEKDKHEEEYIEPSISDRKEAKTEQSVKSVVRFYKTVLFDEHPVGHVDETIVSPKYYNSFNYALLPKDRPRGKMTIGITSPRKGDGKTLVASNLAVSFALSMENDVVLADLNFRNPQIHKIFPTTLSPGFLDAIVEPMIRVVPTRIRNLSVLPAGDIASNALHWMRLASGEPAKEVDPSSSSSGIGLEQLVEFRNIIFSLEEKFDIVIVDLPSVDESEVSTLFLKQLDAVLIVINSGKTKKEDIDALFRKLNDSQIKGFIFNRTKQKETN
jgi:protein-tyrosine kinase